MQKIDRSVFVSALKSALPGVSKQETLEQSDCFVFRDGKVCTFNDNVAVVCPMPETEDGEPLELVGAVSAESLWAAVSRMSGKSIELGITSGELRLKSGRSRIGLAWQSEVHLPMEEPSDFPEEWYDLPKGFAEAVALVRPYAAKGNDKPHMTAAHAYGSFVEAFNNNQAARVELEGADFDEHLIFSAHSGALLKDFGPVLYTVFNGWVAFSNETDAVFCVRTFSEYPTLDTIYKVKGAVVDFPPDVVPVLSRAVALGMESVEIALGDSLIAISAEGDGAWLREKVPFKKYKGAAVSFAVNPAYLSDALEKASSVVIGKRSVRIKTDNVLYITALRKSAQKETSKK